RKARRLMCKLLAKTPVIPKSIFMTGVNARMCSLASRIGIGGFGCVFEGEYQGTRVALKVLYKVRRDDVRMIVLSAMTNANLSCLQDFCREALVWRSLSHPYIMPLLGIYEEQSLYFLVSPYMENGTLADWRNNQNPSTTDIERRIREVAEGVRYIHSEGIVHGDLRGANVLLDDNFHCQIADFGLARHSDITVTRSTTALSFSFSAPELFGACRCGDNGTQRPMKTPETDVYGFGCLYYEIHFDHIPFKGFGEAQIIRSVTTGKRPPRLQAPRLTDAAWNLIQRCWAMEASNRPTMTDIVSAINAPKIQTKEGI
ncbi:kinase-like domain-containing protein, partial [Amanita rubescens]